MKLSTEEIYKEAIEIVRDEKTAWEDATTFVTDKIAFQMRNLIKLCRKNYYGIFDTPKDPITGKKKIFVPLTEYLVDSVVKNYDLDTKDVELRAKKVEAINLTAVVREKLRQELSRVSFTDDEEQFGEMLDELERALAIDGTAVVKTMKAAKAKSKNKLVDLLNVYIDPTARSIQSAYRFTERAVMTPDEVKGMDGWINTEEVQGYLGVHPSDADLTVTDSTAKYVDVWEMWGKVPEYLITGDKKNGKEVEGRIIVSGLEGSAKPKVHFIERNKGPRPYEEVRYKRVPGRWYGRGVSEMVMMLQLWINMVVNIRINRATVSQLGIFKIRKGAGVTPQMLSRIGTNGAVVVNNMDDIEQLVMQEASAASYNDERSAVDWSQKVTSAFEVATGEQLPATTTATGIAVQSNSAKASFVMLRKTIGMFLQRWITRHLFPIIQESMTKGTCVGLTGTYEEIRALDEVVANNLLYKEVEKAIKNGAKITIEQVELERMRILAELQTMDGQRFYELAKDVDLSEYDIEVIVSNEKIDKSVMAQNLSVMLQNAPEYRSAIITKIFDIMGLNVMEFEKQKVQQPQEMQPIPQA